MIFSPPLFVRVCRIALPAKYPLTRISKNLGSRKIAPWAYTFKKNKGLKVDAKYGRLYVKDPFSDKRLIVPFGTVTSTL